MGSSVPRGGGLRGLGMTAHTPHSSSSPPAAARAAHPTCKQQGRLLLQAGEKHVGPSPAYPREF